MTKSSRASCSNNTFVLTKICRVSSTNQERNYMFQPSTINPPDYHHPDVRSRHHSNPYEEEPTLMGSASSSVSRYSLRSNFQKFGDASDNVSCSSRMDNDENYNRDQAGFVTPKDRISRNLSKIPSITATSSIIYLESPPPTIDLTFPKF